MPTDARFALITLVGMGLKRSKPDANQADPCTAINQFDQWQRDVAAIAAMLFSTPIGASEWMKYVYGEADYKEVI